MAPPLVFAGSPTNCADDEGLYRDARALSTQIDGKDRALEVRFFLIAHGLRRDRAIPFARVISAAGRSRTGCAASGRTSRLLITPASPSAAHPSSSSQRP